MAWPGQEVRLAGRRMSRTSPIPAASRPLPMASRSRVWAGEGQGPGRLGVVGVSPVTVKVAAQTGGRVANW